MDLDDLDDGTQLVDTGVDDVPVAPVTPSRLLDGVAHLGDRRPSRLPAGGRRRRLAAGRGPVSGLLVGTACRARRSVGVDLGGAVDAVGDGIAHTERLPAIASGQPTGSADGELGVADAAAPE